MYSNKLYFDNVIEEIIEAKLIDSYKLNKTDNRNVYKLTLTSKTGISDIHYIKINGEKFITNKTRNMIIAFAFLSNLKATNNDKITYDSDKTFSITLTQNNIKVVGLREGNWIRRIGDEITVQGSQLTRIFEQGKEPYEIETGSKID